MTPYLDDGDVRLYHGDALETLRRLPDGSVDCALAARRLQQLSLLAEV